jgi:hypothetical protein
VLGKDKLSEYREIVDKLAIAGVSKQELIDIIEEIYNKKIWEVNEYDKSSRHY